MNVYLIHHKRPQMTLRVLLGAEDACVMDQIDVHFSLPGILRNIMRWIVTPIRPEVREREKGHIPFWLPFFTGKCVR